MTESDSDDSVKQKHAERKRTFKERTKAESMDRESSESRSPSPPLPSRLDRIPSPSSLKQNGEKESDELRSVQKVDVEKVRKSNKERARSRSKSKSGSVEPKRKSKSPKRRNKKRSHSRSPVRRRRSRSRSPRRNRRSRTPVRRRRSRSGSRDRKQRRSRSRERRRRSLSRDRRRSRSRDRRRSPRRRRRSNDRFSRSPSPRFTSKWGMKRTTGLTRAVLPEKGKQTRQVSTQEVEERLAQHMKTVHEKAAEEAKRINLPGYLNPAMVNVHQFKQVQDKRKLLWSKTKDKKEGATQWAGAFNDQDNDEKFRRLMGIQGIEVESDPSKIQQSRQVLNDLEKEYEKSRAFQLSRGAGGVTGMGLGFGSGIPGQPQ